MASRPESSPQGLTAFTTSRQLLSSQHDPVLYVNQGFDSDPEFYPTTEKLMTPISLASAGFEPVSFKKEYNMVPPVNRRRKTSLKSEHPITFETLDDDFDAHDMKEPSSSAPFPRELSDSEYEDSPTPKLKKQPVPKVKQNAKIAPRTRFTKGKSRRKPSEILLPVAADHELGGGQDEPNGDYVHSPTSARNRLDTGQQAFHEYAND